MRSRILICLLGLLVSTALPAFAQETTITNQSGAETNELTPNNIAKNTMALTPELRQKYISKFQNMTPQQQQNLATQAQQAWQNMSPENKAMIKQKAMEQWQNLSPEQKTQMKDQAMQKWQSMSPTDKQQLTSQFQGMLQGQLQNQTAK